MTEKRAAWLSAAAAAAVFLPALQNGFVNWDDFAYLVDNERLRAFDWAWLLTNRMLGTYQPLAWLSYALDFALWGMDPRGFHLTNLLFHAATAGVFCRLAAELFRRTGLAEPRVAWAAFLAALLFALHPLRVESVAWASERRDVLCGLFYLSCAWAWLLGRRGWSLAAFILALSAKGMAVTLPLALLILDRFALKRPLTIGLLTEKASFWVAAAAFGLLGLASQVGSGNSMEWGNYGFSMRLAQSFYGLAFYVAKSFLPWGLSPLYLHPSWSPFYPPYLAAAAAVLSAAVLAWRLRRAWLTASLLFYALTLAPVLGLIPYGPQLVADRYSYLACLPLALAAGAWLSRKQRRFAGLFLGAALAALTVRQIGAWKDSETLWQSALKADAKNHFAYDKLGLSRAQAGRRAEAIALFEESLRIAETASAHNNLGSALAEDGDIRRALPHFERAAQLDPRRETYRRNLQRARSFLAR